MTEYIYKGFKVHYDINQPKLANDLYRANGSVVCYMNGNGPNLTQKFQTEAPTKIGVQQEIKKIINDYINFEWKQYRQVQSEDFINNDLPSNGYLKP